jgi:hypothetical protein
MLDDARNADRRWLLVDLQFTTDMDPSSPGSAQYIASAWVRHRALMVEASRVALSPRGSLSSVRSDSIAYAGVI